MPPSGAIQELVQSFRNLRRFDRQRRRRVPWLPSILALPPNFMMAPAVILLLGWMLVPLTMTLYFSFKKYLPLRGNSLSNGLEWVGFENYVRFVSSSSFWPSIQTTLIIVGGVLFITVILEILLAILLDQPMWGQGVVRILVIAPFFVMPTVSALVWKNIFMDPVNGLLAHLLEVLWRRARSVAQPGLAAIDHHDRVVAMAALRDIDPADRNPVA